MDEHKGSKRVYRETSFTVPSLPPKPRRFNDWISSSRYLKYFADPHGSGTVATRPASACKNKEGRNMVDLLDIHKNWLYHAEYDNLSNQSSAACFSPEVQPWNCYVASCSSREILCHWRANQEDCNTTDNTPMWIVAYAKEKDSLRVTYALNSSDDFPKGVTSAQVYFLQNGEIGDYCEKFAVNCQNMSTGCKFDIVRRHQRSETVKTHGNLTPGPDEKSDHQRMALVFTDEQGYRLALGPLSLRGRKALERMVSEGTQIATNPIKRLSPPTIPDRVSPSLIPRGYPPTMNNGSRTPSPSVCITTNTGQTAATVMHSHSQQCEETELLSIDESASKAFAIPGQAPSDTMSGSQGMKAGQSAGATPAHFTPLFDVPKMVPTPPVQAVPVPSRFTPVPTYGSAHGMKFTFSSAPAEPKNASGSGCLYTFRRHGEESGFQEALPRGQSGSAPAITFQEVPTQVPAHGELDLLAVAAESTGDHTTYPLQGHDSFW